MLPSVGSWIPSACAAISNRTCARASTRSQHETIMGRAAGRAGRGSAQTKGGSGLRMPVAIRERDSSGHHVGGGTTADPKKSGSALFADSKPTCGRGKLGEPSYAATTTCQRASRASGRVPSKGRGVVPFIDNIKELAVRAHILFSCTCLCYVCNCTQLSRAPKMLGYCQYSARA